ncbi:MAG: hypothetical protein FJY20_07880 [Bacteroidetes bacterium]|nr:hypothetical protein [Bacteroidota bacterium]
MKWKWRIPFLSVIAVIHAVYYICQLQVSDRQGAYVAIEAMVTGYTVIAGISAITIDLLLIRFNRNNPSFYFIELLALLTGIVIFYG